MGLRKKIPYKNNNAQNVIKNYPTQWEMYKDFSHRYPDTCLQMDGIVNPKIYENQKIKIMTFLKDSYRLETDNYISTFVLDLCNLCGDQLAEYNKRYIATWWGVLQWVNAIRKSLGENEVNSLQTIAHMNISKLACDGNESVYTRKGVLEEAIKQDGDLLYKQYKEINPNIVICGNNFVYYLKMIEENSGHKPKIKTIFEKTIEGKKPLYCYIVDNKTIVFSAYHPCILNTQPRHFEMIIGENKKEFENILYK